MGPMRFDRRAWVGLVAGLALVASLLHPATAGAISPANAITYVHDDLGRLEAVIDPGQNNGMARYFYDGAGNLLQIIRQSVTASTIVDFSPRLARRNAKVVIYGAGFSTIPSQNTVRFGGAGGTQATVVSASQTQLLVSVPASGTVNGPLFVSSPSGQATSMQSFAEDASVAPTITGISPGIATVGTPFTISGSNFDPMPARNNVFLNGFRAQVISASPTSLQVSVPPFLTGGKVAVQTAAGEGVSSNDLLVPPARDDLTLDPYTAADVESFMRVALNTPASMTIATPRKVGVALFDASATQRVFVEAVSPTNALARLRVIDPFGRVAIQDNSVYGFLDTVSLPIAGSYELVIDPFDSPVAPTDQTGTFNFTIFEVPPDVTGSVAVGGAPVTVSIASRGQNGRYAMVGSAGQVVSLYTSNRTFTAAGRMAILNPDGTTLASASMALDRLETVTLPVSGTYTVLVDPNGASTGSETLRVVSGSMMSSRAGAVDSVPPTGIHASRKEELGGTSLKGRVLGLDGQPVAGVELGLGQQIALSDGAGRFLLDDLDPGEGVLVIDGTTASGGGSTYGVYQAHVELERGANDLGFTIWMPRLDTEHARTIASPTRHRVVLRTPLIPGLKIQIPKGSIVKDLAGNIVHGLGITPIPIDRPPFPMPDGPGFPVYFTIQPGGSVLLPRGARIIYPNTAGLSPGTRVTYMTYEPDETGWETYGSGRVTADASRIVPDPRVRVEEFTGSSFPFPSLAPAANDVMGEVAGGDPVDLATGLFDMRKTDLALPGPMPIALTRIYRQQDRGTDGADHAYPFGLGMNLTYGMYLSYDRQAPSIDSIDLIIPGGPRVHFVRTSLSGTGENSVYGASQTPGQFFGSTIDWTGDGWRLRTKDGSTYLFGAFGLLTGTYLRELSDRFGNRLVLSGSNGRSPNPVVTISSYPSGRWISLAYTNGRITQATDNTGRSVGYAYTGNRLTSVVDASQTGQPIPKTTVLGWTSTSGCSPSNVITSVTDPRGIQWLTNSYGSACRVVQQTVRTATGSETWDFAYTTDAQGRIVKTDVTDPREVIRRYTFDASGYLVTDTLALGTTSARTFTYTRRADHLATRVGDSFRSRNTDSTYDSFGNLRSIERLAGTAPAVTTQFSYEPVYQQLSAITDPLNHSTTLQYDGAGCLDAITDGSNRRSTFECNSTGQVTSMTDPLNHTTTFTYSHGDLVAVADALGRVSRRFTDGGGRVLTATNALSQTTTFSFDKLNQLTSITDPAGGQIAFAYDPDGNLQELNDRRRGSDSKTTFAYNNMNLVSSRTDPLNRSETFTYDDGGNLVSWTDRKGQIHDFTYDPLSHLLTAKFKKSGNNYESALTYTWDVGGRLTQVADSTSGAGTITRTYDDLDRLATEGSLSYGYDAASRRTSTIVTGQPAVTYGYNDADQLTSVTRGSTTVSLGYDGAGRLSTLTFPTSPALVQTYGYDAADQLTGITYRRGTNPADDLLYTTDPLGRRTAVAGTFARTGLPAATTSTAVYDAANRLTSWNGGGVTHDNNGNLVTASGLTYAYNARNQLTSVKQGSTTLGAFVHDGLGRRVQRTISGVVTKYVYDGWNVVQERDSKNKVTANMLEGPGLDQWLSRIPVSGSAAYYLTDALGSTVGLADPSGVVQTSYTYEPFGKTTVTGTSSTNPFRFTGREEDSTGALSLYHYRARYYSPTFGRFLSEDPIGFAGGDANLYGYVGNDPVNGMDPSGLVGYPIDPRYRNLDSPDPVAWLWERIVRFAEGLQDSWSRAQKDWWVGSQQLQTATDETLCGDGSAARLIDYFSWASWNLEGAFVKTTLVGGPRAGVRAIDRYMRVAGKSAGSAGLRLLGRVNAWVSLAATIVDLGCRLAS
jgi:RHS repeat-associated protein